MQIIVANRHNSRLLTLDIGLNLEKIRGDNNGINIESSGASRTGGDPTRKTLFPFNDWNLLTLFLRSKPVQSQEPLRDILNWMPPPAFQNLNQKKLLKKVQWTNTFMLHLIARKSIPKGETRQHSKKI